MTTHPDMPSVEQIRAMAATISATWCKSDPLIREIRGNLAAEMLRTIAAHLESEAKGREGSVGFAVDVVQPSGFTVALFYSKDVPAGTPVYTSPQPVAVVTERMVEHGIRAMWPGSAISKDDCYRMRAALEAALWSKT